MDVLPTEFDTTVAHPISSANTDVLLSLPVSLQDTIGSQDVVSSPVTIPSTGTLVLDLSPYNTVDTAAQAATTTAAAASSLTSVSDFN
ncbi:hypothetical protein Dimus_027323, partial [Dionaea muscipula]